MLLACCFREANKKSTNKKTKKNGKYQKIKENEVRKIFLLLNSVYFDLFRNSTSGTNTIYFIVKRKLQFFILQNISEFKRNKYLYLYS